MAEPTTTAEIIAELRSYGWYHDDRAADRLAELEAERVLAIDVQGQLVARLAAERALADELAVALFNEMGDGGSPRPAQWMVGSYEALRAYQAVHPEGARK